MQFLDLPLIVNTAMPHISSIVGALCRCSFVIFLKHNTYLEVVRAARTEMTDESTFVLHVF